MRILGTKPWTVVQILSAALTAVGCVAPVGVSGVSIPPDAAATCASHCESIGLRLSAVAIMADNVGCVCDASKTAASDGQAGKTSTPAAGMATVLMQAERQRRQEEQQQLQAKH